MVLANFQLEDKQERTWFFQETFLVANTAIKVVLGIFFLALSKVQINFAERELTWKTYSLNEALPTTKRVQIIDCREFAAIALAVDKKVFVVYVAYLGVKMLIYPAWKAQMALLLAKKVSVPKEYTDFSDVFSKELGVVLPERSDINEHTIDLEPDKQTLYRPIYR